MNSPTLYGIANCDQVRNARKWLDRHGVDYRFHDYRKHGLSTELLESMVTALGWEKLLNRRGTTWRKLPDKLRDEIDRDRAIALMLQHPAIIKRPVLRRDDRAYLGFDETLYAEIFDPS